MLGIDDYGSDSDSDVGETPTTTASKSSVLPAQALAKPSLSLPPPATTSKPSGGLNLPPPKSNKRRDGPVRITVDLPKLKAPEDGDESAPKPVIREPGAKTKGAGASSLLAMLPKPKQAVPTLSKPKPLRVLGGGASSSYDDPGVIMPFDFSNNYENDSKSTSSGGDESSTIASTSFVPMSTTRPKPKSTPQSSNPPIAKPAAPSAPVVDFFSLGATSKSTPATKLSTPASSISSSPSVSISSAPVVTEFTPPPPTPIDPYPGYYQLPSGDWAAYDPGYYKSVWESWHAEATDPLDIKGKRKERGWEDADEEGMQSVDANEEMKRGQIAEREAKKNLTAATLANAPGAPKMNIKVKAGGRARQKGQLSALLTEAYENRSAIEERIAQAKRNKKEAGNKYGF